MVTSEDEYRLSSKRGYPPGGFSCLPHFYNLYKEQARVNDVLAFCAPVDPYGKLS